MSTNLKKMGIDADLVASLIGAQFPQWSELPIFPSARQGHDNRTFRLGDDLSVRLPSAGHYAAAIAKEDRVLPIVSPHVSIDLPDVVATGRPTEDFPLPWSVRRWLPGDVPADAPAFDRDRLVDDLAAFLVELRRAPADAGPACGRHSFFRGCHPSVYADEVEQALAALGGAVNQDVCRCLWRDALTTAWPHDPVWFHGDFAEDNMLIRDGALGAVIDFGTCGVGDPACDLVVAWTFMGSSERDAFRAAVELDADTWARARGWALWKALITVAQTSGPPYKAQRRALATLVSDPSA